MRQSPTTFSTLVNLLRVSGMDSPNRLAAGLCLGICLGLLPKFSLLTWCLAVLCVLSTTNLLTLLIGFACGCLLVPAIDPLACQLGERLISWEFLASFFSSVINAPFGSLLQLDNSAMTGSLACGLIAFLPAFFLARAMFQKLQPVLETWLANRPTTGWMVAANNQSKSTS